MVSLGVSLSEPLCLFFPGEEHLCSFVCPAWGEEQSACAARFEYLDQDLKKLLDMCDGGLDPATTKALQHVSLVSLFEARYPFCSFCLVPLC